jgi:hypothetical protein
MANKDAPFGLAPIRHLNGNPWNGVTQRCLMEDDVDQALFIGDPVIVTGTAGVDDTSGLPVIILATAGDTYRIYGVIVSFEPDPTNLERKHHAALTKGYANVCIDPDVVFIVQDDAGATLDGGSISDNAVLAATAGSTVTGLSGWELAAATTPTSDASYQLLILDKHHVVGNDMGDNCIWEVLISNHILRGGGAVANEGFLGI